MKILMVNKFLYPRGGAESYMLKVGDCLKNLGHEVQYFGMYDEKNTVGNNLNEYTTNMDFHTSSLKKLVYPFKIIYSSEAKKKIGKVLDDFKPDIVHMNNINFQLTPSIIDAVKKRNIPLVQTVHDFQMICPNHLLYDFNEEKTCVRCIKSNKLHCIRHKCVHKSLVKSIIASAEAYLYKIKGTYKKVDKYICPSSFLEGKLLEDKPETFKGKTAVIHNFVEKHSLPENAKSNFDFPYVSFAGRLSAEKGVKLLAETAGLLPDVNFVVMGNGPEEKAFEGLKNVYMTGFITGDTLNTNIAYSEVIAVPSVCFENCPLSILEARDYGVPAVTQNFGGMAELVSDGETGVLSKEPTPEAFSAAIKKALCDKEKLAEMKKNCNEEAKNSIDINDYCEKVTDIYGVLLKTNG